MCVRSSTNKKLIAGAFSGAKFFFVVGPIIGFVVFTILQIIDGHGLENPFTFLLFAYLFGAVPAIVSGVVFGLTNEMFARKQYKLARFAVVIITSIVGVTATMVIFKVSSPSDVLVPLMASTATVACCFLRFREIDGSKVV